MPRLIYIMGTARSGSTILEIMLAAGPGVFGAGEISHIFQDGFLADNPCACGRPATRCAVWGGLLARLGWSAGRIAEEAANLRAVEAHGAFPRLLLHLTPRPVWRRYADSQRNLIEGLAHITGAQTVVDSSKYAGRALALGRIFPADLSVVGLTRSPEGLLAAFQKPNPDEQKPKSILGAALYYLYVTTAVRITASLLGRRAMLLRYEDLAADPAGTLLSLERWSGMDLSAARGKIERGESFPVGHIVTGNRLRKEGAVRMDPASEPPRAQGAAWIAAKAMNAYRVLLNL